MATSRAALDRIAALCGGDLNPKSLREQVLAQTRQVVPCDGFLFALTDPETKVATSPLADLPMLPWSRLPELIRWRYQTPLSRWDVLLDSGKMAASLQLATDGHPERSLVWRMVQRELGVLDTVTVPFGDRQGCWGVLDLWRTNDPPFGAQDLAFLAALAPPVTTGLREAVARSFVDPEQQLLPMGSAVVVLEPDLQVSGQTDAAAETLLRLNPPGEVMAPVPAAAYNVGAALLAAEQGLSIGAPWSRVHLGGSRWLTVKASRLGETIAISIEPSTPADRMGLFARAHGLSPREKEILALIGAGHDSRAIAGRLFLSEHTVNDHVKAILSKTRLHTRHQLIGRAIGAS